MIRSHAAFLKILYECNPRQRRALIQYITAAQLEALSQVSLNILKGHLTLTVVDINKLRPYKNIIFNLASRSISQKRKKEAILKHPVVIQLLLSHIIPLIDG